MAFVYTISHPLTGDVFYVGATTQFNTRIYSHLANKYQTSLYFKIKAIKDLSLNPSFEVIDECDIKDLKSTETYWIHQLMQWGFNLVNVRQTPSCPIHKKYSYPILKQSSRKKKLLHKRKMFVLNAYTIAKENGGSIMTTVRRLSIKFKVSDITIYNDIRDLGLNI